MPFDPDFWTTLWEEMLGMIFMWLPSLFAALVLLLAGWLAARLAQFLIGGLLRRLRLDRLAERVGIARLLANVGMDSSVANLMARLAYWLILLVFVLAAAESLGALGVVETLNRFVGYLPNVLAAAMILLLGSLVAQVIGDGLREMTTQAGVAAGPALGQAARYTLIIFAIILALDQLGIQTDLLTIAASALVIAITLALALAFGIGSRELARNIMSGYHARESYKLGQHLQVRGHSGKLVQIGPEPEPDEVPPAQLRFEPLRVLTPRITRGAQGLARFIGRFGLVLLLTVAVLLIPRPEGLSPEGHRALAVFVFTGSILALEPVSLPIAALMVPVAQVALGVADTPQAFETFSRPVVFLILASLFLAEALRKHGLTRRLALTTIVRSGGGISRLVLGLMSIAALFSMWVENTATAAVLIPVALTIAKQLPDPKKGRKLLVLLVLGIAYAASLGGMVTIMGSASNAVAAGFLAEIRPWTFVDWMVYGLSSYLLIYPLTWWLLLRLVKAPVQSLNVEPVHQKLEELGPMSRSEREVLCRFSVQFARRQPHKLNTKIYFSTTF